MRFHSTRYGIAFLVVLEGAMLHVCGGSSSSGAVLHICNRGYCFNKKEKPISPSAWHLTQLGRLHGKRQKGPGAGIDFCQHYNGEIDCELFGILGAERVDEEFEALECAKGVSCEVPPHDDNPMAGGDTEAFAPPPSDEETIELDYIDEGRISWKERPLSGKCYDNHLNYEFDCNLVQILDEGEGLVLIQDLRLGGVFAAQPKANFTMKRSGKKSRRNQPTNTPTVLMMDDPVEDFRTVRAMNMEGF